MKKIKKILPLLLGVMVLMFGTLTVSASSNVGYTAAEKSACDSMMSFATKNNLPTYSYYSFCKNLDGTYLLYNSSMPLKYINIVGAMLTSKGDCIGWALKMNGSVITINQPAGTTFKDNTCLANLSGPIIANYDVAYYDNENVIYKGQLGFFPTLPVALKAVGLPEVVQSQTKVILITAVACLALLVTSLVLLKKLPRFLNR